jgi:hypothetical protein
MSIKDCVINNLWRVALALATALVTVGGVSEISPADGGSTFYYEFGIELSYKTRPLTIRRVIECLEPNVAHRTFPATGRSQEAIAEKLEDGSGLIAIIPNLCDHEAWPLSPAYVPLLFWTATTSNPQLLEGYLSEDLLKSGKARITLLRVFARPTTKEHFVGAARDFTLFSSSGRGDVFRAYSTRGMEYMGLTARVVPRDEWARIPELAPKLSKIKAAGIVPSELLGPISEHFPFAYDWDTLSPNPKTGWPRNTAIRRDALDKAVSLRWAEKAFEIAPELRGTVLIYPVDKIPTLNLIVAERNGVTVITKPWRTDPNYFVPKSEAITWPLRIDATSLEVGSGTVYFDPASGRLLATGEVGFFLFANPDISDGE